MSKHTPGPWAVVPPEPGESVQEPAIKSGDYFIATIHDMGGDDGAQESDANGRLIESAPRLLASLRKTLAAAIELHAQGIGCPDCPPDHEDTGQDCPLLAEAEAVIAKAEGRS